MSIISESFCKKSDNIIELNLTRFCDCCVMAMRSNGAEKKLFNDHVNYVFDECSKTLSNNGKLIIYKNIIENGTKVREDRKSIESIEDLNNFKNNIKDSYKL